MGNTSYRKNPLVIEYEKYKNDNIMLLGEGGFGKSTCLQCLNNALIEKAEKGDSIVPIFIDLKDIDTTVDNPICEYLYLNYCGEDTDRDKVKDILNGKSKVTEKYKLVIIIDGINEPIADVKGKILSEVDSYIREIFKSEANIQFVISSRVKETDKRFRGFKILQLNGLSDNQIKEYIENKFGALEKGKTINSKLVEILRAPFFMSVFSKTYDKKSLFPDIYEEKMVRKSHILHEYVEKLQRDTISKPIANEIITEFILNFWLPKIAFDLETERKLSFPENDFKSDTNIDRKSKKEYCENFLNVNNTDIYSKTLENFDDFRLLSVCLSNYSFIDNNGETCMFSHEYWKDYFAARHIQNLMNTVKVDELEKAVEKNVRQFVGELVYQYNEKYKYSKKPSYKLVYKEQERKWEEDDSDTRKCECDFEDKDNLEEWTESPIEYFMQENHNKLNGNPITICNLIEIMKTARNNHIIAKYDYLDLRQTELYGDNYNLSGSTFHFSKINKTVFQCRINGEVLAMCFSKDSKMLAHFFYDDESYGVYVENLENNESKTAMLSKEESKKVYKSNIGGMFFFNKNSCIAVNLGDCFAYFDLDVNYLSRLINYAAWEKEFDPINNELSAEVINSVKLLQKNRVVFYRDGFSHVFEISKTGNSVLMNGKIVAEEDDDRFNCISISENGNNLFTGTYDGKLNVYTVNYHDKTLSLEKYYSSIYSNSINCLAISSDKEKLAYADFHKVTIQNLNSAINNSYNAYSATVNWETCMQKSIALFVSHIWENELCVNVVDLNSHCTVQTMIIKHENFLHYRYNSGYIISENGDYLAVVVDKETIQVWMVDFDKKIKIIKTINFFEYVHDKKTLKSLSLCFDTDDSRLLLCDDTKNEILHGWSIGERKLRMVNNEFIKIHISQNKHQVVYSNIIGCDFSCTEFLDDNEKSSEDTAMLLYQNGAVRIPEKYLNMVHNLMDNYYSSNIKIPIRLIVDAIERQYGCVYSFEDKLYLRRFMIACLNLWFCKPDDLLGSVSKFAIKVKQIVHNYTASNGLDNYIIKNNTLYINNHLEKENQKKYEINFFKAIAEAIFNCNNEHIVINNVLTEMAAEKIYNMDVNDSRIIMPKTVQETICGENIDIRAGYDNYNLLISLAKQLFIAKGINENKVIADMFIHGFDTVLSKLKSDNDLDNYLEILDIEYSKYINRFINGVEDETEIQLINDYQMQINDLFDETNQNYLAFCALITQDELRQKAISKLNDKNKSVDASGLYHKRASRKKKWKKLWEKYER